jgi:hypothetical protein
MDNIKARIDALKGLSDGFIDEIAALQAKDVELDDDITGIKSIPNIINIKFNDVESANIITVTLDKSLPVGYSLVVRDLNTGDVQSSSITWSGNIATITIASGVIIPFMVVVQG